MNRTAIAIALIALPPVAAFAGTTGEAPPAVLPPDETRMSVEIPLEEALRVTGAELLRVNELLDERTEFDAENFRLAELVLVARSEAATAGEAELLIMDWRSGEFDIPAAAEGEWYEVRIPAPEEDIAGAWLLDLVGDVTVDMLVAVLEPSPEAAALLSGPSTRTVYRVVDGRRAKVTTRWVHSPHYYHVYHYHHGWPYRYFWGPWHYELVYRPHFRHHYRYHDGHRQVRHKLRDTRRHHRKLRRIHPRARVIVREHRTERTREARRTEHRLPRAEPRRDRSPRHSRTRRGERQHAIARESARSVTARPRTGDATRRGDVARPLPNRRDYVRTAPSESSRQTRPTPRATATQPHTQTSRLAPERATTRPLPRQREFARRPAPRPTVAPVERSVRVPTARQVRQRPADSFARQTATPPRAPQRTPARTAPPRRDFDRSPPRQVTPAPARTEVRPRPRPQPQAAPRRAEPPPRPTAEAPPTEPPRSRRPSRGDRPERHIR